MRADLKLVARSSFDAGELRRVMGDEWADEWLRLRRATRRPSRAERRRVGRLFRQAMREARKRDYQAARRRGSTRASAWLYSYASTRPLGWPWARS